ncbi:MAG: CTP synthase [Parcubacteria group bacterium Greene0416_79]|nr:MAG: CTP synthase [Parcubacteria group bacterium Greene0416_79]
MSKKNHKYIFVIGGVMSGVGKGIATSAIGALLQAKGFKVNLMKIDPYLNVDAGTMNPTEHGEVFVLNSGLETDQDMGNYERFLNRDLGSEDYMTSGMVYRSVIERERSLGYGGKFVEAIPHITDEIRSRFQSAAEASHSDVSVIEIGGTVGDYQNFLFIEAARVLNLRHPQDVVFVLVSYLPVPGTIGEMKTKPTQNAVHQLNSYGVQPDFIIARGPVALDAKRKEKLAIWCNVKPEHVISAPDISSIYDVPVNFEREQFGTLLLQALSLRTRVRRDGLEKWKKFVRTIASATEEVRIGIVGKYFDTGDFVLSDAYISVIEALKFSAYAVGKKPVLSWINAKDFEKDVEKLSLLAEYDGIVVPGGFGETGIEGKLSAIRFARENKIPYLGLCYGMQLAVIEYARNAVDLAEANTTEINKHTPHPVIDIMPEQKKHMAEGKYGATMRLGAYPCFLKKGTIAGGAYVKGQSSKVSGSVSERHRHRYEVNPEYVARLEKAGLVFSGTSPDGVLMEIAELPRRRHPFFLGTQFHPELQARPLAPHPLFTAFLKAAVKRSGKK